MKSEDLTVLVHFSRLPMSFKSKIISSFFTLTNLNFCWLAAFGNKTIKLNYMLTETTVDLFLLTVFSTWCLRATANDSRQKFLDDTIHSFELSLLLLGINMKCAALTSGGWKSMWCRAVPTVTLRRQMLWASTNRKTVGVPPRPFGETTEGSQKVVKFNNSHQSGNSAPEPIGDGQFNRKTVRKNHRKHSEPGAQREP